MEQLDLTSLTKAIRSLKDAVIKYQKELDNDIIRDSVIQRFEYTYALSLKMIQRYLSINVPILEEQMTFNNIIRQADKIGLLKHDLQKWTEYREMRNITSHTYDDNKANLVAGTAVEFLKESEYLLDELQNRNNS